MHGSAAGQVRRKAAERVAEQAAAQAVARLGLTVQTTAAEALQDGLARVNAEVVYLAERVAQILEDDLTWGVTKRKTKPAAEPGGEPSVEIEEQPRKHVLWVALDDAITRRSAIAADMSKLRIEERRQDLLERDADMIASAWERLLTAFARAWNLSPQQMAEGRQIIAGQLEALGGAS